MSKYSDNQLNASWKHFAENVHLLEIYVGLSLTKYEIDNRYDKGYASMIWKLCNATMVYVKTAGTLDITMCDKRCSEQRVML